MRQRKINAEINAIRSGVNESKKTLRLHDARVAAYMGRKPVRNRKALIDEIMSLLDMHGALTCNRLALMVGVSNQLVARVLEDLMTDGRLCRNKRLGSRGRAHLFWSVSGSATANPIRFHGATILRAFQQIAGKR